MSYPIFMFISTVDDDREFYPLELPLKISGIFEYNVREFWGTNVIGIKYGSTHPQEYIIYSGIYISSVYK